MNPLNNGHRPTESTIPSSSDARDCLRQVEANLQSVIKGKNAETELVLVALASAGHVLLEDAPGTGKNYSRQSPRPLGWRRNSGACNSPPTCCPPTSPAARFITRRTEVSSFVPVPVFANVLLADEINRTSPRTQSALLEVMSENQVSTDGRRHAIPAPFFVVATQNPSDYAGTYPLPEAQLDRFMVRVSLGYPDEASELDILYSQNDHHPLDDLQPVRFSRGTYWPFRDAVRHIHIDRTIGDYIVRLTHQTRGDARLRVGLSPRGSLALYRTSQARAWMAGRDFVLPEDVRALAVPVLAHRLILDTKARYGGAQSSDVINELLESVPVPR